MLIWAFETKSFNTIVSLSILRRLLKEVFQRNCVAKDPSFY